MTDMQWGSPPQSRYARTGVDYEKVCAELKQQAASEQWAKVFTGSRKGAVAVYMGLKRRGCKVATHTESPGVVEVWAHWDEEAE